MHTVLAVAIAATFVLMAEVLIRVRATPIRVRDPS
jgi:hypothetical protein